MPFPCFAGRHALALLRCKQEVSLEIILESFKILCVCARVQGERCKGCKGCKGSPPGLEPGELKVLAVVGFWRKLGD